MKRSDRRVSSKNPAESIRGVHVERFRWSADIDGGYAECQLVYDRDGNLLGMDYQPLAPRQLGG